MALYGLGSMLGAGVYGLIGTAAGQVGNAVWLAFIVALIATLLTALSYTSLGSRYPRAAGAAYVTQCAYGFPLLSFMVGLALVCSGLTSVATQSRVFAPNLIELIGLDGAPVAWLALGFVLVMAGIVFRGIRESMWVNILCTIVEAAGLILVVLVGMSYLGVRSIILRHPQAPVATTQPSSLSKARSSPSLPLLASKTCTMSPRRCAGNVPLLVETRLSGVALV